MNVVILLLVQPDAVQAVKVGGDVVLMRHDYSRECREYSRCQMDWRIAKKKEGDTLLKVTAWLQAHPILPSPSIIGILATVILLGLSILHP